MVWLVDEAIPDDDRLDDMLDADEPELVVGFELRMDSFDFIEVVEVAEETLDFLEEGCDRVVEDEWNGMILVLSCEMSSGPIILRAFASVSKKLIKRLDSDGTLNRSDKSSRSRRTL